MPDDLKKAIDAMKLSRRATPPRLECGNAEYATRMLARLAKLQNIKSTVIGKVFGLEVRENRDVVCNQLHLVAPDGSVVARYLI